MKAFCTLILLIVCVHVKAQSKADLISEAPMDSVVQYEGEGTFFKGNCLLIKYSGDAQKFLNEIAAFHVQDENQVERTKTTLAIYETARPFWVLGKYSVFVELLENNEYTLIEIHFKAFSNPNNYKIATAQEPYQKIINRLLSN